MNIFKKAIGAWGVMSQLGALQEECAEVIVAVNKIRRATSGQPLREPKEIVQLYWELAQEVADVELCCKQMRYILPKGMVEKAKANKVARLEKILR